MEETVDLLHFALAYRMFTNKEYAECISATVSRYGTPCTSDADLVKLLHCFDLFYALVNNVSIAACMSNENAAGIDIRSVSNAISDILLECHAELATVLFTNDHFTVLHHDAGLELQQIGSKSGNCRATSALM